MKRCVNESTLQSWLDGELTPEATAAVRSHLAACNVCAAHARQAEQSLSMVDEAWQAELPVVVPAARLRARVEEGLAQPRRDVRPWWHITFPSPRIAAAAAVLAIVVTAAVVIRSNRSVVPPAPQQSARLVSPDLTAQPTVTTPPATPVRPPSPPPLRSRNVRNVPQLEPPAVRRAPERRPTLLEGETGKHLEQAQLLLRSVRNAEAETVGYLAYERELSRELLSRNRWLRRTAEKKDGRRAEELLSQIEPFLLDIANLPDEPAPEEVTVLKELIRDQHIIAELQLYAGRNLY